MVQTLPRSTPDRGETMATRASLVLRALTALALTAAALCGLSAATASAAPPSTLYVNAAPVAGHSDRSCASAAYATIGAAVTAAAPASVIVVCPGVYHEGVLLNKQLTLRGLGATIDATTSSFGNGVQIIGPGGSGSTVEGFRIENAEFEGILVGTAPVATSSDNGTAVTAGQPVNDVTIADNTLVDNGTGFNTTAGQCFSTPNAPGDCGETIHLVSVTNSTVTHNYVADNIGGILLTDEFGPTSGDVVSDNEAIHNQYDCGITLAGHNPAAVSPVSGQPTGAAGVFNNLVEGNISNDNGVLGQGAGILLGGGAPFAGVYNNTVRNNVAIGDGLAGVTLHQHFIGDLNGNVIEWNLLSDDNVDGDQDFAAAVDSTTTGILVAAGLPPGPSKLPPAPANITGTVIRFNVFYGVATGIWTLGLDPATTQLTPNFFLGVPTPIVTN
jgi:hypothetical protein